MNRRDFLKNLLGLGVIAATPKLFIDMGAAWQKRESGLYELEEFDFTAVDGLFKKYYGRFADNLYSDNAFDLIKSPNATRVPVQLEFCIK